MPVEEREGKMKHRLADGSEIGNAGVDAAALLAEVEALRRRLAVLEERLHPVEQAILPSLAEPPERAKQAGVHSGEVEAAPPLTESIEADELRERLRIIAGDLMYWKGGLKILKQARLPKRRGSFQWQIEAQIESLQAEYAKLRAECAKPDV